MWQEEQGIMIGAVRHNDKTSIARIFTHSHGMVPFVWYMSNSGKSASRNTLLQPLTHLSFQAEYVPSSSLHHLKAAKNSMPYRDLPFNSAKSAIVLFLSEFLTHALNGEQANPPLYRHIADSALWLDKAKPGSYANFHIAFMLGTAHHLGICPNAQDYKPGYLLDMREGLFVPTEPDYPEFTSSELSYKLWLLMTTEYDKIVDAPLTGQERVHLLNSLNSYFRLHIPIFPILKSIEILESVFE